VWGGEGPSSFPPGGIRGPSTQKTREKKEKWDTVLRLYSSKERGKERRKTKRPWRIHPLNRQFDCDVIGKKKADRKKEKNGTSLQKGKAKGEG